MQADHDLDRAPRLRAGLTLVPRAAAAGGGIIVSDREGRRHFQVEEEEGRLLELLDGTRSLKEIHVLLAAEFPAAEIDPEMVVAFTAQLESLGLLEGARLPPRPRGMVV